MFSVLLPAILRFALVLPFEHPENSYCCRLIGRHTTDVEVDEDEELFPDGGYREDPAQAKLYETELDALLRDRRGDY